MIRKFFSIVAISLVLAIIQSGTVFAVQQAEMHSKAQMECCDDKEERIQPCEIHQDALSNSHHQITGIEHQPQTYQDFSPYTPEKSAEYIHNHTVHPETISVQRE